MKNKLLFLIIGIIVLGAIAFAIADVDEIMQLENSLSSSGYDWLINYSVDYSSVGVYREGLNESVARFENISSGNFTKYIILLTNLSENESYMVPIEIIGIKIKLDEIKMRMKNG